MISENVSLLPYNTFGIDVKSKYFAQFSDVEELRTQLKKVKDESLLIIGGGSNILFTKDFDGATLKNEIKHFKVVYEDNESVHVNIGAGEVWHDFVLKAIDNNFGGVENLSLIPGSVGASPMQNIGAYGAEIKDILVSLDALHIETGEIHYFKKKQCQLGYRESIFKRALKDQYIILNVTFRLSKRHTLNTKYGIIEEELEKMNISNPTIKDVSNAVIAIRSSKLPDPKEIGNAGSFFKNPVIDVKTAEELIKNHPDIPNYPAGDGKVKLAAGWLIEQAGWKGKTFDNFGVHKNQALVLVNYKDCTGKDILDLSTSIITDVFSKFGIKLEREVNIL